MNRKQRRARLKRMKLTKKMMPRREAIRRLTGRSLAPGSYVGTPHVQNGVIGLLVQTPAGPTFVPQVLALWPKKTGP